MFNDRPLKVSIAGLVAVLVFLLLVSPTPLQAKRHLLVPVKNQIAPTLPSAFKEVGYGRFSVLFWNIYDSRLLTKSGSYKLLQKPTLGSPAVIFEITYLRDISKDDLLINTVEQWQHLNILPAAYEDYIPKLKSLWPEITEGDTLSLFIKNGDSYFYHNKIFIGVIAEMPSHNIGREANFGYLFLSIWLSPETSQPKLRKKLLGIED